MSGIVWWTPARLSALAELLKGGASYPQAAAAMSKYGRKITSRAVETRAAAAGLKSGVGRGRPRLRPIVPAPKII
jgi:site-specific recombinase XerC